MKEHRVWEWIPSFKTFSKARHPHAGPCWNTSRRRLRVLNGPDRPNEMPWAPLVTADRGHGRPAIQPLNVWHIYWTWKMKILMALTPRSELAVETGYLNGCDTTERSRIHRSRPSPHNHNQCCHCTTFSLGKQQVYVIKRQVLAITWLQRGQRALFVATLHIGRKCMKWYEMKINSNTFFFFSFPQCCRHQLSKLGQSRMSSFILPASFTINHTFSFSNFHLAFSSRFLLDGWINVITTTMWGDFFRVLNK